MRRSQICYTKPVSCSNTESYTKLLLESSSGSSSSYIPNQIIAQIWSTGAWGGRLQWCRRQRYWWRTCYRAIMRQMTDCDKQWTDNRLIWEQSRQVHQALYSMQWHCPNWTDSSGSSLSHTDNTATSRLCHTDSTAEWRNKTGAQCA